MTTKIRKHVCSESPESCYRHEPYTVHGPVFEGGFQVYDPAHELYVGADGKAMTDTAGPKWWMSRAKAEAVAARLNKRDGRYQS